MIPMQSSLDCAAARLIYPFGWARERGEMRKYTTTAVVCNIWPNRVAKWHCRRESDKRAETHFADRPKAAFSNISSIATRDDFCVRLFWQAKGLEVRAIPPRDSLSHLPKEQSKDNLRFACVAAAPRNPPQTTNTPASSIDFNCSI